MWMLSFVPDYIVYELVHLILIVGLIGAVVSYFFSKIPLINKYILPVRVICALMIVFGVYAEGSISNEKKWKERVKELEDKVKIAEEKSKEVNTVIETKIVEKVKTVKQVEFQVVEKIKEVEKIIDAKCELDPSVISILNEAAKGPTQ